MRKHRPVFASRRILACSRDTSTDDTILISTGYVMPPRPMVIESFTASQE